MHYSPVAWVIDALKKADIAADAAPDAMTQPAARLGCHSLLHDCHHLQLLMMFVFCALRRALSWIIRYRDDAYKTDASITYGLASTHQTDVSLSLSRGSFSFGRLIFIICLGWKGGGMRHIY